MLVSLAGLRAVVVPFTLFAVLELGQDTPDQTFCMPVGGSGTEQCVSVPIVLFGVQ
jgi:hypothetical protein